MNRQPSMSAGAVAGADESAGGRGPHGTPGPGVSGTGVGLHDATDLPSKSWTVDRAWVLAANSAADLDAWTRLLGLHDQAELTEAEPDTMRFQLYYPPVLLSRHARRRLRIEHTWPWATAFTTAWTRILAVQGVT
ncbi:hypothetical protein ABCR94_30890 [Streptomyces sp. 21So2-11]|uniref:hypothetical protein n=1 Tax=Streptomyces sp. 21So2-11 TaxID=3144408 RepID=UPI003219B994